jgi:hypothetical protein
MNKVIIDGILYEKWPEIPAITAGPADEDGNPSSDEYGNWVGGEIHTVDMLPQAIKHWWTELQLEVA